MLGKVLPLDVWRAHLASDPRAADFPGDAVLWVRLLSLAFAHDGADPRGLFGALSGIRALGAGLQSTPSGVRIVAGELGDVYGEIRAQWLLLHAGALRDLLRLL
jgi:hypothetical protein